MLTSRFTQDCLENLFSTIRLIRNPVPTPLEFKNRLKIITIGQYLKTPATGSYIEDDNEYMVDFLKTTTTSPLPTESIDQIYQDYYHLCNLSKSEEQALYYLAGYCIQSLRKKKRCSSCFDAVTTSLKSPAAKLLNLKEYKPGLLCAVTDDVVTICHTAETIIRKFESKIYSTSQPRDNMLKECLRQPTIMNINVPDCHNLKQNIVTKYITVRLQLLCRKLTLKETKPSGRGLGSKSIAMRQLAKKI